MGAGRGRNGVGGSWLMIGGDEKGGRRREGRGGPGVSHVLIPDAFAAMSQGMSLLHTDFCSIC